MSNLLLDKYEIVREIGKGGMGMVYEARDVTSGRRVAVKWMHGQSFAEDDPNLLRFQQEARIAGALDSPHVTVVYECARERTKDVVFQVMELLEGEDLRLLLERVGALDPDVALCIATQACAGLSAAHKAGVVHRDIKPENIFLSKQGQDEIIVKLLDFGIAKIRPSPDAQPGMTVPNASMTSSGQMLGTPLYMAPEQFEAAKHADARADVYSMGVTLYAMLAGSPPNAHLKSFMHILRAVMTEPTPSLLASAPWVRPDVAAIVEKAMQKECNARYADATEMLAALRHAGEGLPALRSEMLVAVPAQKKSIGEKNQAAESMTSTAARTLNKDGDAKTPWWKRVLGR